MNLTQVYEEPARRISCRRGKSQSTEGFCRDCAVQSRAFCAVLNDDALTKLEGLHTLGDVTFLKLGHMGLERLWEWLLGSLVVGTALALFLGFLTYVVALTFERNRRAN